VSRTLLSRISLALVLLLVLTCLPVIALATGTDTVTISYLSRYSNPEEPRSKFYMDKLAQFQKENPGIIVEDISVQDSNAYISKVKASVAAGSPPDVYITDAYAQILDQVKSGMVKDISGLINSPEWTGPKDPAVLYPWTYEQYGIKGVYGCPNQVVTEQMFVNTKILKDLGLEVPETWEDIIAMVPTLAENGYQPVSLGSKDSWHAGAFHTALFLKMYGAEFRDKFISGQIKWTDPESVAVFEKFKELIDAGVFGDSDVAVDTFVAMQDFCNGNYPMLISPSFFFSTIQASDLAADFTVVNIPYFKDHPEYKDTWSAGTGEGFVITSEVGTPEYDAACKLLTFLMSKQTFSEYAAILGGGVFPVDVDFDASKSDHIMKAFMDAYAKRTASADDLAHYSDMTNLLEIFRSDIQLLFTGKAPADIAATIQNEYDKFVAAKG
jgi:raffinose/stachyose/melibiose transport system substrate-binding protein